MRLRSRMFVPMALCALGVGALGVARAQTGQPGATPGGAATPPAQQGAVGLQRPVNLTIEEMRRQGDLHVSRIEATAGNVRRMLETARSNRDFVKTLCLNDKLNQLDVTLRSAKERLKALETAAGRRDNELSRHEFTILGVYRERTERVASEANQCVGSEAGYLGDSRVTSAIDPTIPDGEGKGLPATGPTAVGGPNGGDSIFVPPATCASCSYLV